MSSFSLWGGLPDSVNFFTFTQMVMKFLTTISTHTTLTKACNRNAFQVGFMQTWCRHIPSRQTASEIRNQFPPTLCCWVDDSSPPKIHKLLRPLLIIWCGSRSRTTGQLPLVDSTLRDFGAVLFSLQNWAESHNYLRPVTWTCAKLPLWWNLTRLSNRCNAIQGKKYNIICTHKHAQLHPKICRY